MKNTLETAEVTTVDSCEAETASTISTSTVKHEVESKITVDEDGPTGSELKDSMENRSPQEKKLAAVFAQAAGQSTVSGTAQNSDSKDPAKPLVTFTAQDSDKLTAYESIIGKGIDTFVEVGASLAAIRDASLYRKYSPTFEGYVKVRWNFTKQRAYQLIQASDFRTKLVDRNAMANRLTTERATREMMKVPPDMVAEVLEVVLVDGEPTAERIIKVREKIAPKKDAKVTAKKKPAINIKAAVKAAERTGSATSSMIWWMKTEPSVVRPWIPSWAKKRICKWFTFQTMDTRHPSATW